MAFFILDLTSSLFSFAGRLAEAGRIPRLAFANTRAFHGRLRDPIFGRLRWFTIRLVRYWLFDLYLVGARRVHEARRGRCLFVFLRPLGIAAKGDAVSAVGKFIGVPAETMTRLRCSFIGILPTPVIITSFISVCVPRRSVLIPRARVVNHPMVHGVTAIYNVLYDTHI